ncbi:hypothetical protein E2C01_041112 [Portunus trituberculatus]|uniref:Uncharacterized protein n=1 Tax=Portunus trituberculatus TaxID=210409 RepID=A0A5B7FR10_PORTR|nr:hypothetical protein [Portunus trituberculatus]
MSRVVSGCLGGLALATQRLGDTRGERAPRRGRPPVITVLVQLGVECLRSVVGKNLRELHVRLAQGCRVLSALSEKQVRPISRRSSLESRSYKYGFVCSYLRRLSCAQFLIFTPANDHTSPVTRSLRKRESGTPSFITEYRASLSINLDADKRERTIVPSLRSGKRVVVWNTATAMWAASQRLDCQQTDGGSIVPLCLSDSRVVTK